MSDRERALAAYQWKVGDVFINGPHRWKVDSVHGDQAVLRSCSTSWATTRLLTFDEWHEGGRWQLEAAPDAGEERAT